MGGDELWLFHSIIDGESAPVRRYVAEKGQAERVRFRNVTYPEVASELAALGGGRTPALWNGERLIEGRAAVLAYLEAADRR